MSDYSATWSSPPPKFEWKPDVHGMPEDMDPKVARWAEDSVTYGEAAGVDPRLVMAIVLNEGADANLTWDGRYGELKDWLREYTTPFRELKDGHSNSLGLTNMKEETFDKLKAEYPSIFSGREWTDLTDDQSLAIQAAAYNLAYIKNKWSDKIPADMKSQYSLNQVLAAGYNAEGFFGDYIANGELGHKATLYSKMSRNSFGRAQRLMEQMYTWKDAVDPGMPPWPVEPGIDVVDIPPPGGYPAPDGPTHIADRSRIPVQSAIRRIVDLDFPQGGFEMRAGSPAPWAAPLKRAEGGDVQGPGSSIGDKIPAWLSDGEFVMNARSTAVNRPFLQALNADPFFLQKMMASRSAPSRNEGAGAVAPPSAGGPATVNIAMANDEDIIGRLKVLAMQWELSH
ncbi:hypothetical protein [Nocardia higoensis]|uniref:hypothetical protein n=1 Tax=Nocardia higoensis TaxID=228599 RepID=UPI0012F648BB|nr:hypothetical protein [Nocardia higoensis]